MRSPWLLVCVGGTPKPKKAVKPDEAEKALAEFKRATDRLREMVEAEKILGVEVRTNAVPRLNAVHNTDFTMVKWFGTEYHFALGVQSLAVRALWEEWDRSGLGLHQETIRDAIDAERDSFRMDTAFRNHPAWGTMIQRCGDGRYRLAPPDTPQAPSAQKTTKSAPKSRRKRV